ncbi:MAG: hypothetical protein ACRC0H_05375, partial [Aeromonas sobria]
LTKLDMALMWGKVANPSRANTKKIFSRTMKLFDCSPVSSPWIKAGFSPSLPCLNPQSQIQRLAIDPH